MSATIFVHIEDSLISLSTTGAAIATIAGMAAGVALGARRSGIGMAFLGAWATGLLLSMVSTAVLEWGPVRLSLIALGGVIVTGWLTAAILTFIRRSHDRRAQSAASETNALVVPGAPASLT